MYHSLPLYKRLLSYIHPITIETAKGDGMQQLELQYYHGQYQLATADALYSDGMRYRPMLLAFDHLEDQLPAVNKVLLLGTGLASAAHILISRGYSPAYTFVEEDERILKWALELLPAGASQKVNPVAIDAEQYMRRQGDKYDLVLVDVFIGRVVPDFVTSITFLEQCKDAIQGKGHVVINYIVNDKAQWQNANKNIQQVFPENKILKQDLNRVIVATV